MLMLPSKRNQQLYKNGTPSKFGSDMEMIKTAKRKMDKLKLTKDERYGGLVLDEINIQNDLVMKRSKKWI